MHGSNQIRIGTRSSQLARWQANWVASKLRSLGAAVETVLLSTHGDQRRESIASLGAVGVFTKAIQQALLDKSIDLAVHSLKDLPTEPIDGLSLTAIPPRESNRDVWISRDAMPFEEVPDGATVGTGSLRRRAQLLHLRPELNVLDIRGNVDTRLNKLDQHQYDAIVLAEAGLLRLGLRERITQTFSPSHFFPAVGQGALGLETRIGDAVTAHWVSQLDDVPTRSAALAERAMLAELRGGCLAPIGAWGRISDNALLLDGVVLTPDGKTRLSASFIGDVSKPEETGKQVAQLLIDDGARDLIRAPKGQDANR